MSEVRVQKGETTEDVLKRVPVIKTFYRDGSVQMSPNTHRPETPVWVDSVSTTQEIDPDTGRPLIKIVVTYRPFDFFS